MKRYIIYVVAALLLATTSCKKKVEPDDTEAKRGRDILYGLMGDWYFWYKEMPQVTPTDYADANELLEAMRYRPIDRWSFVTDYESFTSYYEGSFAGHGIRIGLDDQNKARIAMIYRNSPLYPLQVRRGWIVKSVNGVDIAALLAAGNFQAYNTVMGAQEAGITNIFVFTKPDGTDIQISSKKAEFQVNSVLHYDTLNLSSGKTGYLAFEAFIEPSFAELEEAFGFFLQEGVRDMILDLRYNSGGMLDVADSLASYLAGNDNAGSVFVRSVHNDRKTSENRSDLLRSTSLPIDVRKLVVLTTRETASASENIINGMVPYTDVATIGDTTNGKPVGMYAFTDIKKVFVFAPITFQLVNAAGEGDFFDGIIPVQLVSDDITRDFGDRQELMLKAAIEYLETGGTKSATAGGFRKTILAPGRPGWQKNLFINTPDKNR